MHADGSAVGAWEVIEDERLETLLEVKDVKDDDVGGLLDNSVSVCEFLLVDFLLTVEVVEVVEVGEVGEVVEVVDVSSSSSFSSSSMTFSASRAASSRSATCMWATRESSLSQNLGHRRGAHTSSSASCSSSSGVEASTAASATEEAFVRMLIKSESALPNGLRP